MSTTLISDGLTKVIQELRHRLMALHLTDVRITTIGRRVLVDARFHDCHSIANVRQCCDEMSQQMGVPISVTCTLS